MDKKIILSTFFVFAIVLCYSQTFDKVSFNDENPDDYYITLMPPGEHIRGVLVLLPGYGERPESIFPQSKLFNVAYANHILTVAIAGGPQLYADEKVIDKLNRGLLHLFKKYPSISKDTFVVGGFSAGGTIAVRYAEYCAENPQNVPVVPKGVFAVDSPLDLFNIWDYFQREIKKNYSAAGVNEAKMVTEMMKKAIGTPESNTARYNELTPFNYKLDTPGNERFLKTMAVRVYEDLDVNWQLAQRRRSLYDNNALIASELINRLLLMGNERAEFVTAKQPGHRSNGMRHPHSWSIVDEVECIQWMLAIIGT